MQRRVGILRLDSPETTLPSFEHSGRKRRKPSSSSSRLTTKEGCILAFLVSCLIVSCIVFNVLSKSLDESTAISGQDLASTDAVAVENNAQDQQQKKVALLRPRDYQGFTIRINTWKRLETLHVSLDHHVTCPSVLAIQVVWCTAQGPPPDWLLHYPNDKVSLELHNENSLNERFRVLSRDDTTAAILSLDDDILRPCIAYDQAFVQWLHNPDRIVGFDARSIVIDDETEGWRYGYQSTTERSNQYSLTLTRCCFIHVDYLQWYVQAAQYEFMRQRVAEHLNCEDIAVSLLVSSFTGGRPPLLAELWVVKSMIKLTEGDNKISAGKDHKKIRDACVNDFAAGLGLKQGGYRPLQVSKLYHDSMFAYGDPATDWNELPQSLPPHLRSSIELVETWKTRPDTLIPELSRRRAETAKGAYNAGLLFQKNGARF